MDENTHCNTVGASQLIPHLGQQGKHVWLILCLDQGRDSIGIKVQDGAMVKFGLVSLFNGISTFVGYLMPKSSFEKNSIDTI